jgi:hypothetical protein
MRRIGVLIFVISLVTSLALAADTKPTVSNSAMDADQVAVYQAFLSSYNNGSKSRLNLSKLTSVFNPAEEKGDGCLKGIQFDIGGRFGSTIHEFDPHIALPTNVRLVDPNDQRKSIEQNDPGHAIRQGKDVNGAVEAGFAAGLLTLSEVAFDKGHRYAAMNFSFVCGGLCGHGSTIVFEKRNGKWQESKRPCSVWMS